MEDTVIAKNQLSSDNVKFGLNIVKGSGNNFYLDDIKIGEQNDLLFDQNVSLSSKILFIQIQQMDQVVLF